MFAHTPSLFLALIVAGTVLAVSVGVVSDGRQRDGLRLWALGLGLHSLAYSAFFTRSLIEHDGFTVAGNTLLSAAVAFFTEALCEFYQQRPRRLQIWSPVLVLAVGFTLLLELLPWRVALASTVLCLQAYLALRIALRHWQTTAGRGKYFLMMGLTIVASTLVARAMLAGRGQAIVLTDVSHSNPLQAAALMGALASLVLLSIGFVLMTKDRADALNQVLATRDELTGLANRRSLNAALEVEWARARRGGQPLSLVLMDVDHFKAFNDHYGHQHGDTCLQAVANVLQACSQRAGDLAARYGGEEFLLILPNTDAVAAQRLAENARATIQAQGMAHASSPLEVVTISAGVATLGPADPTDGPSELLRRADRALYQAKQAGRNQVHGG